MLLAALTIEQLDFDDVVVASSKNCIRCSPASASLLDAPPMTIQSGQRSGASL
jgi:hypothetical protein